MGEGEEPWTRKGVLQKEIFMLSSEEGQGSEELEGRAENILDMKEVSAKAWNWKMEGVPCVRN